MITPDQVISELDDLKCTKSCLAGLTKIPSGTLSDILNGNRPATHPEGVLIRRWLLGLRSYVEATRPLPINYKDTNVLREQIQAYELGHLKIMISQIPIELLKGFSVRLLNGNYFLKRDSGGVIGTMNFQDGAVFTDAVADELVEKLTASGVTGHRKLENRFAVTPLQTDLTTAWEE